MLQRFYASMEALTDQRFYWLLYIYIIFTIVSLYIIQFRKKPVLALLVFSIGAGSLALWHCLLDPFLWIWDEQYHAVVASNLKNNWLKPMFYVNPAVDYDYKNWVGNHIWVHKQPLFLWQMAASLAIFGNEEWAVRLPDMIMLLISGWLVYSICARLYSRQIGFYAGAVLMSLYYPLEKISGSIPTEHNDMAFFFYMLLSVWGYIQFHATGKYIYLFFTSLGVGGAVLCKWLTGLLIFLIWSISHLYLHRKNIFSKALIPLIISVIISVGIFLPWQLYIFKHYPAEAKFEMEFNSRHLTHVIEGHDGEGKWHYHLMRFPDFFGGLEFLLYIAILGWSWMVYKTKNLYAKIAWILWPFILIVFYTLAATKMESYTWPAVIPLYIGLGVGVGAISEKLKKKTLQVAYTCLAVLLFLILPHVTKSVYSRLNNPDVVRDLKEAANTARQIRANNLPEGTVIYTPVRYVFPAIMFYTGLTTYEGIPDSATIQHIRKSGRNLLILDSPQMPSR